MLMLRVERAPDMASWQRIIGASFVPMSILMHPKAGTESPFYGLITRLQLGVVSMSKVSAGAHVARRTERDIRLHPADYYKASLQIEGTSTLCQHGRTAELSPGDIAFYDTAQPYELHFGEPNVSLVVQIPRSQLFLGDTRAEDHVARPLDPLPGTQVFLESQFSAVKGCGPAEASHRGQCVAQLLNAVLMRTAASGSMAIDAALLDGAQRYALAHLSEPELRQEDVARANFVSVRSLQRAFASRGTSFASWVREQRLERARTWILDTDAPIARIATDCGFSSAQHFSRLFRERYGIPPRSLRKAEG
jgi:AraC-like DNA-binding protein